MEDNKKQELVFQLINNEYLQPEFKDNVDLSNTSKFPISEIAMLGTAFLPLAEYLSSNGVANQIISKLGTDTLYTATNKAGEAIQLVNKVKGETRFIGSYIKNNKTAQARFNEVSIKKITSGSNVFNPATMIMAAELMYIAKEVNTIKQCQQQMFEHIQIEKRSRIEGDLSFLTKVLNDYKYNFDNDVYKASMHIKILDIKQDAEQTINSSKKLISSFLNKNKDDYNSLGFEVQNYQTSLFLYAFSSFVEIIVLENFDKEYLDNISKRIRELSQRYREVYTNCYNYLESKTENSLQSTILKSVAKVSGALGEAIAKTKLGDKTQIDETLIKGEVKLNNIKETSVLKTLNAFANYKDLNTNMFIDMISSISFLYNQSNTLMFDNKYLYLQLS